MAIDDPSSEPEPFADRPFGNRRAAVVLAGVVLLASTGLAMFLWPKAEPAVAPMLFLRLEVSAPGLPADLERRLTSVAEAALLVLPRVARAASYTDTTGVSFTITYARETDLDGAERELRRAVHSLREERGRPFERYSVARKTTPYNWPVKPLAANAP